MIARILAVLLMLAAAACLLFGLLYFAGLKANVADKYGASGKTISVVVTFLTVPLFNLGRFLARRNRTRSTDDEREP